MVKEALAGLHGIRQADASFEEAKAWVVYDPSAVTVEQMVRAIDQAGFQARPLAGK